MTRENQEILEQILLTEIGRGSFRENLLERLCPEFDQPLQEGQYLQTEVGSTLDSLVERGILAEVLFGVNQGWILITAQNPRGAAKIEEQNNKGLDERADRKPLRGEWTPLAGAS